MYQKRLPGSFTTDPVPLARLVGAGASVLMMPPAFEIVSTVQQSEGARSYSGLWIVREYRNFCIFWVVYEAHQTPNARTCQQRSPARWLVHPHSKRGGLTLGLLRLAGSGFRPRPLPVKKGNPP